METDTPELTKESWEASVSSRCWSCTPYDQGWDRCPELRADRELAQIVEMERHLESVPEWAGQVVERVIQPFPPCGHYRFPLPFLEAVSAIGGAHLPELVHGCFTVDPERKRQLQDYILCLDAWLAGAGPDAPAAELMRRGARKNDWHAVCRDFWDLLGECTGVKELLVERLILLLRRWVKFAAWDDEGGSSFGRDQFLGTGLDDASAPRVAMLEQRLAEICPDWERFRTLLLEEWWLCAPKAFRFLEKKLWFIGKVEVPEPAREPRPGSSAWWTAFVGADVPGFLRAQDTYPDTRETGRWWSEFCVALDARWRGAPGSGAVADDVNARLGQDTPAKRWLVRLFLRRIKRLEENDEQFTRLVNPVLAGA
jgi:hypothetical protein